MSESVLSWLALAFTVGINLATVAYMTGNINARITQFEKEMIKVEAELKEMRTLLPTLATIRVQLDILSQNMNELKALVKKDLDSNA